VTGKLKAWKVEPESAEKIIGQLISEDFLNEERFARSFASGKFRNNYWGKTKIIYELKTRKVADHSIQTGLDEIDEEEYIETLKKLLLRKNQEIREEDPFKRKQKLIAFGIQKGYHYNLIKVVLEEMKLNDVAR